MDLQEESSENLWKYIGKPLQEISGRTQTDISWKNPAESQEETLEEIPGIMLRNLERIFEE